MLENKKKFSLNMLNNSSNIQYLSNIFEILKLSVSLHKRY